MHKLKLPLLLTTSAGYDYVASQAEEGSKIDLTDPLTGHVYKNHCEQTSALDFFSKGSWKVKNAPTVPEELAEEVTRANAAVAAAVTRLASANEALAAASRPYLA